MKPETRTGGLKTSVTSIPLLGAVHCHCSSSLGRAQHGSIGSRNLMGGTQIGFTPSNEQQAAIDYRGGHLQIIACAGSGKTEATSQRVAKLIDEGLDRGPAFDSWALQS